MSNTGMSKQNIPTTLTEFLLIAMPPKCALMLFPRYVQKEIIAFHLYEMFNAGITCIGYFLHYN
jgi:hypothetical protein